MKNWPIKHLEVGHYVDLPTRRFGKPVAIRKYTHFYGSTVGKKFTTKTTGQIVRVTRVS